MMNWLARLLGLIPVIVAGIEQIHGDSKSGAEKKQLALEALELASGTAGAILPPADHPAADAATKLAGDVIDGVSAVFAATKVTPALPAPIVQASVPDLSPPSTPSSAEASSSSSPAAAESISSSPAVPVNPHDAPA